MIFPLLHRKGLQTPANTHQFNSVSWMHTLKIVLLGSLIFLLHPDYSQYSMCVHSLGDIQTQLPEKRVPISLNINSASTLFGEQTHSRVVWRIRLFFVLDRDLPLFVKCLYFPSNISFLLFNRQGLKTTANTHLFISVPWMHTLKIILLRRSILILEADIFQYSIYCHSLWYIKT